MFYKSLLLAAGPVELLKSHWPAATSVEKQSLLLTGKEIAPVNSLARVQSKDRVYRYYRVEKNGEVLGFGIITSQMVRTKTMAIMVVVGRDGKLKAIDVLAFYEPPEYKPSDKWLSELHGKKLDNELNLRRGITNITGATLSARAVVQKSRLILALFATKLKPGL